MAIKNMSNFGNSALAVIAELKTDVYLGGSRRMAHKYGFDVGKDTDYDFYATYSEELVDALFEGGFGTTSTTSDHYGYGLDSEAIQIFYRDNVQIVLRKDAIFYERVFESIPLDIYINYLWKSAPHVQDMENHQVMEFRNRIGQLFNMFFELGHLGD